MVKGVVVLELSKIRDETGAETLDLNIAVADFVEQVDGQPPRPIGKLGVAQVVKMLEQARLNVLAQVPIRFPEEQRIQPAKPSDLKALAGKH